MGGGKGLHGEPTDFKGGSCLKGPNPVLQEGDPVAQLPPSPSAGVNRHGKLLRQRVQPADMVRVLVCNQDTGELAGVNPQFPQAFGNPPGGDTGVDENVDFAVGHQQAVAAGAAGEGGQ